MDHTRSHIHKPLWNCHVHSFDPITILNPHLHVLTQKWKKKRAIDVNEEWTEGKEIESDRACMCVCVKERASQPTSAIYYSQQIGLLMRITWSHFMSNAIKVFFFRFFVFFILFFPFSLFFVSVFIGIQHLNALSCSSDDRTNKPLQANCEPSVQ